MQARDRKPSARYKVPRMETRFPTVAFLALLIVGFFCLYAALRMRPNYGAMPAYRNDPAYQVTSRVFLKFQTFSNAIASGNNQTVSQIQSLAHKLIVGPTAPPLKRNKLPKH